MFVQETPKEMLLDRKAQLEKTVSDLERERTDLSGHIKTVGINDQQVAEIEEWCAEVRTGLDMATFEDKLRYFDLLDVRGKLAFENNEKMVYIKCKVGKQRVSLAATSHSSNRQLVNILLIALTTRLVLEWKATHFP